jgi:Fe-S cluster biogenesis protein NfuA
LTASEVDLRLDLVRRKLRGHAGGVELQSVSADGVVHLRFTGMCAGCVLKPLTMAAIVKPAFSDLQGVADVVASGARVSAASAERLRAVVATTSLGMHER